MPVPEQPAAVERHLLRDTAYRAICDAIVSGTLTPGEQLHDAELCTWLELSRTPVREALLRLEDDGLVETLPQRYTRVTPLTRQDAQQTFPVLAALHALATALGVPRLAAQDLQELDDANAEFVGGLRAGDRDRACEADRRFHAVFVRASGNRELARTLERIRPRLRRLERVPRAALPGRRAVAQHQAVAARAASGDAAGAASAARENWTTMGLVIERALTESERTSGSPPG